MMHENDSIDKQQQKFVVSNKR